MSIQFIRTRDYVLSWLLGLLLVTVLIIFPQFTTYAATITVTTAADSVDCASAPVGSLRAALCGPLNPGDIIDITIPGPINLVANLPIINVGGLGLTINGSNAITSIVGGNAIRVFTVTGGGLSINKLSIAGGACNTGILCPINGGFGGGIYLVDANLTAIQTTFTGNFSGFGGGAIAALGTSSVNITDSTFSHNNSYQGGAIEASQLTIVDSEFTENTASYGGAIFSSGPTTIDGTKFLSNTAIGQGGAISNGGTMTIRTSTFHLNEIVTGGAGSNLTVIGSTFTGPDNGPLLYDSGIWLTTNGTINVSNSTFFNADNEGFGAIRNGTGVITVTNSTFVDTRGRAIFSNTYNGGSMQVNNSIVAGAAVANQPNCYASSPVTTNGAAFNLSTDTSCGPGFTTNIVNLNLGTLGNYGGPTQTIPLLAGSAAIGKGEPAACPATDQRGVARTSPCSIGAFEGVYTPPAVTPPLSGATDVSGPVPLCFDPSYQSVIGVRAEVPTDLASIEGVPANLFCKKLNGPPEHGVANRPVSLAIEVTAFMSAAPNSSITRLNQPVKVCLQGAGTLLYRDATGIPRVITDAPNVTFEGGYTCARITQVGTLILIPGTSAPSAGNGLALNDCQITTLHIANLRETPDANGQVITLVPYNITLKATERTGDWIKVVYLNGQGYLNRTVVNTNGSCGE